MSSWSETDSKGSYGALMSPAPAHSHAISIDSRDPPPNESISASHKQDELPNDHSQNNNNGNNPPMYYDHDMVMIFPRREGGELKKPYHFTVERFVSISMGKNIERSARDGKIIADEYRRVFRTKRCFLDDNGNEQVGVDDEANDDVPGSERMEQIRLREQEELLVKEYEQFTGGLMPTSEVIFCELVATAVARRIQLACGLTTRMFRGCDNDVIIMTITADDNDLRVEADRTDYRLQVSNKPFDRMLHHGKLELVRQEIGEHEWKKSINLLKNIRGVAFEDSEFPEMDPLLISRGEEYHPKIYQALTMWGHTEVADGLFIEEDNGRKEAIGWWRRFCSSLVDLAYDPMTYFSPFAGYRREAHFQPYYRRYPIKWGGKTEETLFAQKDRIRLVASIIDRHLNTDALKVSGYLNGPIFALHDDAALKELRNTWALRWRMLNQPLNKIRFYFGEKVALYFAWLEFYTKMLVFPSIAGIITYIVLQAKNVTTDDKGDNQGYILIAFAVFIVIWSAVFSEIWKRKTGLLNSLWGLYRYHGRHRYRAQFRGVKCYNSRTDKEEMTYESKARRRRAFFVSSVVILMMTGIVIVALIGLFLWKHYINEKDTLDHYNVKKQYRGPLTLCVTGLNALQIIVLNLIYRKVAGKLNEWENHRTDREFENHLVIKVFLFQFCNSFASFFYIAFVKRALEGSCINDNCMTELHDQLLILFLIRIVLANLVEIIGPYIKYRLRIFKQRKAWNKSNYVEEQANLTPYEERESFEDYNEMVIQFGFITLFVVAFPLTPLLALVNNVVEIHVDSIKLCYVFRRPFPHAAKSIGAWFYILRFLSYISLATNTALILWTSDLFENSMSNTTKAFVFVVAFQVCMMIVIFIERIVPDMPKELGLLMERNEYIVDTVYKGLREDNNSGLKETAESLDLTIYPNNQWQSKPARAH